MIYSPIYFRSYGFPYFNPAFGFGFTGYGVGINAIGSQFSSQSLVNTGTYTGSSQIQSPVNVWG